MDKNVEVICLDDSDNEDFKESPQTSTTKESSKILVISSDEDANEFEIVQSDKNLAKHVSANEMGANVVCLGTQSQATKNTNFLAATTAENFSRPVNVDFQKSTDKVNVSAPQGGLNYQLTAQGSELTILQDNALSGKPNVTTWRLVAYSSLQSSSQNHEKIPSPKVDYTPGCNLGSDNKLLAERQNSQSSDINLKRNVEMVYGTSSTVINNTVPVITNQPEPVTARQPEPIQAMSVMTPPVPNSVAITAQNSSLQSVMRAPLATNVQRPRNPPVINQNAIRIPVSISTENLIRNSVPLGSNPNFLLVSPFSNAGVLVKPPTLQQFPNQLAPNQSSFPVIMGANVQNALRPQTAVQNNQSKFIVMQTVSKSTTQLSTTVPRTQNLKDFAQLVLINPSQQRENKNNLPSSSVNKTTLLNSNGNKVQFCINGDSNLELRPLVSNPPNSGEQTVTTNPLLNFSCGSQSSNVNMENLLKVRSFPTVDPVIKLSVQSDSINANLSGVTQMAVPPWKQNEANCDRLRDPAPPETVSLPPWLKKAATQTESFQPSNQSCISSNACTQIKLVQSIQTEVSVKPPTPVVQLLSCLPQSPRDPNSSTLFRVLTSSDPKSQYNAIIKQNQNSIENFSIQNKPSNVELETHLSRNVLQAPPSTTYEEHATHLLSKSTQCNSGININTLDSKSLQPSDPDILQISGGTEFDWKPCEISTGKTKKIGHQLEGNLKDSCLDKVDIAIKTEDDVILLDDSSDEELKEILPADDPFQPNVARDLLFKEVNTKNSEGTSEKTLGRGQDIIRIQIDATLNKPYDHSGLKINVNNGSFQKFPETVSNLSSIDIKEEINGTNFTINYSSTERGVPAEKQYRTINNDRGSVTADCKTRDVKDVELLKAEQEVKTENSDETAAIKAGEFKMENDAKCIYADEELSAKIKAKSESEDSYEYISKIEAKSESEDSYEYVSKIEAKSESEDSYEEISKIEAKSESEDSYKEICGIGSPDVDVSRGNDSSNETDYEVREQNQYEYTDLSEVENDYIDHQDAPTSLASNSSDKPAVTSKDEKPFVCPYCGFCVAIERNLVIHINAFHTGNKAPSFDPPKIKEQSKNIRKSTAEKVKFKCTSCDFEADKSSVVSRHLQTLHGVYACIKCNFRGSNLDELKTHEGTHKTVKCVLCDSMIALSEYQSHLSTEHPVTFRLKCKSCDFKANAEWQLRNHLCMENTDDSVESSRELPLNGKRKSTAVDEVGRKRQKFAQRCTFICKVCDFRASNETSLSIHHKLWHFVKESGFQCNYCPFKAESKLVRTKHCHESHPEKFPYVCHICNFRSARKNRLEGHKKRHFSSQETPVCRTFLCKHCNFETDNTDLMTQHENEYMHTRSDESNSSTNLPEKNKESATINYSSEKKENTCNKIYPCKYCDFLGETKRVLNEHRYKMHTDKLPYSCKKCIFRAPDGRNLERHETCVHKLYRKHYSLYECKLCSFKTSEISLLSRHKYKNHRSRYRFKCSSCSYRTPSKGDYINHVKNVHKPSQRAKDDKDNSSFMFSNPVSSPRILINSNCETEADLYFYYCSVCDRRYKFISDFEIHNILVHDKCRKCPYCWTFVSSMDQLFTHKYNAHSSMFKFKCSSCSFCSLKETDVSNHENLFHKSLVCHYCDFSVGSIDVLNSHILNSHPERNPLFCDKCGYQTMNENFLRSHKSRMHPKIKCLHCEFVTDSKRNLLSHISENHSKVLLTCTTCSFFAEATESMVRHKKTCHDVKCDACSELATSSKKLGLHKFQEHPKTYSLMCLFCNFQANRGVNLIRHELNVHFKRTYRCTLCFFYSETISGLSDHFLKFHSPSNTSLNNDVKNSESASNTTAIRVSTSNDCVGKSNQYRSYPIECRTCNFRTATATELYKHYADDHPSIYRWSCMLCTYRAKRFDLLFKHLRSLHSVAKFYRCKYCPFVGLKQFDLFKHQNSQHAKEFCYKCDLCPYNSHKIINLQIHCRNKHKRKLSSICVRFWEGTWLCSKCDFWSKNKMKIKKHIHTSCFSQDDTSSDVPFGQRTTGPTSTSNVDEDVKQDLQQKILLQKVKDLDNNESISRMTPNKDLKTILKCSLCKFCTSNRSELKFHGSTIHNTSSLYVCDWCSSKTDYDLGSIIVHIEKEHKTDIKCPACSFTTLFKTTLREHIMREHSLRLLQ